MKNNGQEMIDPIKQAILGSTLNLSKKIYKAFNSVFQTNSEINCKITLEDYNHLEMGFGLRAAEPIWNQKEILRIPIVAGLNGLDLIDYKEDISKQVIKDLCWKTAKNFFPNDSIRQEKSFQNNMLMWQVLINSYYKDGYNSNLVLSFPDKDLTHPVYATKEIYEKISSQNLKKYYGENKLYMQMIYNMISKEGIYEMKFEEASWAYNNVLARKIVVQDQKTELPIEMILPIFDYINHSSTNANCYVEPIYNIRSKDSFISLRASRNISENEQLFFNYGSMYNKKFMSQYGFFDIENPIVQSDFYFIGSKLPQWLQIPVDHPIFVEIIKYYESNEKKIPLYKKNGLDFNFFYPECNIILYENKFDSKFIKFFRILFLNDEELTNNREAIYNHDFTDMYSIENEKKVFYYINFILNSHYNFVKNTNHLSEIDKLGNIDNVDKFKTKCMILLEKEEKFLLEKNLKYVNIKLNSLI